MSRAPGHFLHQPDHGIARQQFRRVLMRCAARQDGQCLDIGLDEHVAYIEGVVDQNVEQSLTFRKSQHFGQRRSRHVCIDQQDRPFELHRDAHREICGGEALAFSGQGAGNNDEVRVPGRPRALYGCILYERALDHAELVGE